MTLPSNIFCMKNKKLIIKNEDCEKQENHYPFIWGYKGIIDGKKYYYLDKCDDCKPRTKCNEVIVPIELSKYFK